MYNLYYPKFCANNMLWQKSTGGMQKGLKLQGARWPVLPPLYSHKLNKKIFFDQHCRGGAPSPSPLNPPLIVAT